MKSYLTIAGAIMLGTCVQAKTEKDVEFLFNKIVELEEQAHELKQQLASLQPQSRTRSAERQPKVEDFAKNFSVKNLGDHNSWTISNRGLNVQDFAKNFNAQNMGDGNIWKIVNKGLNVQDFAQNVNIKNMGDSNTWTIQNDEDLAVEQSISIGGINANGNDGHWNIGNASNLNWKYYFQWK
ncbi:UNKNOWN [Stylonychia lemnae]|uniref:Uncharacterized protein n=1 Tax=Stylonychia lemnae TaxID=5949 RepID=A0A078ALY6_STYLE|nr:UNKNOWN [Stylonychia lemnae]|eukprot:CDW83249.1 UNKNOWN [Stylonychia lemnae]